jgi:hypothetical protein
MSIRKTAPVFSAALAGFLLGAMFAHQAPVKAQSGMKVTYKEVTEYTGTQVPSTQVIGFSCVPHRDSSSPDCYVAYAQ